MRFTKEKINGFFKKEHFSILQIINKKVFMDIDLKKERKALPVRLM